MTELPKRKHPRLRAFDYSTGGYYHVTVCTKDNLPILSSVTAGRGFAPTEIKLTSTGKIIEKQLLDLEFRYASVKIDKYIIMPTHLHVIIVLQNEPAGASPRPTLMDIICTFKSLSTRVCNQFDNTHGRKIWQTSFYDEIIRNEQAHSEIWQ